MCRKKRMKGLGENPFQPFIRQYIKNCAFELGVRSSHLAEQSKRRPTSSCAVYFSFCLISISS